MTLTLLRLDDRTLPAAMTWYGGELFVGGRSLQPFAGWSGSLVSVRVDGQLYVGAGDGGGPRVAVFNQQGERLRPDYWAGDPLSRAGVAFVVPERSVELPVDDGPVSAGPAGGYPLFLDFEDHQGVPWRSTVFSDVAALLANLPVRVTTERPDALPRSYGQALIAPSTFLGAGGGFPGPVWTTPVGDYTPRTVYVGDYPDPHLAARVVVHEFGHALGFGHVAEPDRIMSVSATATATLTPAEEAEWRAHLAPLVD